MTCFILTHGDTQDMDIKKRSDWERSKSGGQRANILD